MGKYALKLVKKAFKKKELDLLLLGEKKYAYLPDRFSPAIKTDLYEILKEIHEYQRINKSADFEDELIRVLMNLASSYEGLRSVASFILHENNSRNTIKMLSPLQFSLDPLGRELSRGIRKFKKALIDDYRGYGRGQVDGLYGDIRRLSKIIKEGGGPNFFDDVFSD